MNRYEKVNLINRRTFDFFLFRVASRIKSLWKKPCYQIFRCRLKVRSVDS
jgi:hypothetical protein